MAPLQPHPNRRSVGGYPGGGLSESSAWQVATVVEGGIALFGVDAQGPIGERFAIGGPGEGGGAAG